MTYIISRNQSNCHTIAQSKNPNYKIPKFQNLDWPALITGDQGAGGELNCTSSGELSGQTPEESVAIPVPERSDWLDSNDFLRQQLGRAGPGAEAAGGFVPEQAGNPSRLVNYLFKWINKMELFDKRMPPHGARSGGLNDLLLETHSPPESMRPQPRHVTQ